MCCRSGGRLVGGSPPGFFLSSKTGLNFHPFPLLPDSSGSSVHLTSDGAVPGLHQRRAAPPHAGYDTDISGASLKRFSGFNVARWRCSVSDCAITRPCLHDPNRKPPNLLSEPFQSSPGSTLQSWNGVTGLKVPLQSSPHNCLALAPWVHHASITAPLIWLNVP